MTPEEKRSVAEGLAYLRKWLELRAWTDAPPPDDIRQGSVLLRRLLLDRDLVRAWHSAGFEGEPEIVAVDLAATVAAQGPGTPEFALAGSARNTGEDRAGIAVRKSGTPAAGPVLRVYSLSQYLESPSIVLGRTTIARREVIKYLALANGASEAASVKGRKKEQEFAAYMQRLETKANGYRAHALQLELYSIGQAVAQTPDVRKLLESAGGTQAVPIL
jgi:hypothetical protein